MRLIPTSSEQLEAILAEDRWVGIDTEAAQPAALATPRDFTPDLDMGVGWYGTWRHDRPDAPLHLVDQGRDTLEHKLAALGRARVLYGWNILGYDYPVMLSSHVLVDAGLLDAADAGALLERARKASMSFTEIGRAVEEALAMAGVQTCDLMQVAFGGRRGYDAMLRANDLGGKSSAAGALAPHWYQTLRFGQLATYLTGDVVGLPKLLQIALLEDEYRFTVSATGETGVGRFSAAWKKRRLFLMQVDETTEGQTSLFGGRR